MTADAADRTADAEESRPPPPRTLWSDRVWADQPWSRRAACRGENPDLFFGPEAERPETRELREAACRLVCARCPVLMECRAYAREHREFGFWGGETEHQRALAGHGPRRSVGTTARIVAAHNSGLLSR